MIKRSPKKKLENFIRPMLSKETDTAFDDKEWLFEIKWDGYRAISEIKNGAVKLYSRNGLSFDNTYPTIFNALKKISHNAVLDGEIVVLNKDGKSNFQQLQHYEENNAVQLYYYVFDILLLNGKNVFELPLIERKKLLKKLINKNDTIKYSDHVTGTGKALFNIAVKKGLEGIMAKKANSNYHKGIRTADWLKIKQHKSTEVIITGY
ncbi:ATP-dependent DNA ligase, partial [Ferruginibacter sp.]